MHSGRFLVAALSLLAIAGCKSSGTERSEARVESMKQVRASLEKGTNQIDITLGALDQVTASAAAATDARPAFTQFKTELAKLDANQAEVRSLADGMRAKAQAYFEAWEAESRESIKDPEILKISEDRRTKAKEQFETLRKQTDTTGETYRKFSAKIHEVEKVLEIDLNPSGITALTPAINQTKAEGKKAQESVIALNAELDKVAKALSAGAAAAPAPASASTPTP